MFIYVDKEKCKRMVIKMLINIILEWLLVRI